MSLQEDMENQASGTGFILEVPEVNILQFIGADGKDEIQWWITQRGSDKTGPSCTFQKDYWEGM